MGDIIIEIIIVKSICRQLLALSTTLRLNNSIVRVILSACVRLLVSGDYG